MIPRTRALVGAATGALLVLVVHPITRPALLAPFRPAPPGGLANLLRPPPLPKPTDVVSGAAYLHAGAERLLKGPALTLDERKTLLKIAAKGEDREPENAFWPDARFVFGADDEAQHQWLIASHDHLYDDHQTLVLEETRQRLVNDIGDDQAWTYAAVTTLRSNAMARCLVKAAARALKTPLPQTQRDALVCETIRNGALLRDGSRRLGIGRYGIAMIEGATYPPDLAPEATPHRLWSAKTALTSRLRANGHAAEAELCDAQFRTNDAWQAFSTARDPEARFQALILAAVAVGVLPGALLAASLFGVAIMLFGKVLTRFSERHVHFRGPELVVPSLVLMIAGLLLGYPWVGGAAAICAWVPGLGPERTRRFDGSPLGPFYAFVVGTIALGLIGLVTLVAISYSLAGRLLPEAGDLGAWCADTMRLGAFVVVLLGASAFIAPSWAIVRRFATPVVAATTYRNLGRQIAIASLALAILLSPIALATDRWLGVDLRRIEQNEVVYYNPGDANEH